MHKNIASCWLHISAAEGNLSKIAFLYLSVTLLFALEAHRWPPHAPRGNNRASRLICQEEGTAAAAAKVPAKSNLHLVHLSAAQLDWRGARQKGGGAQFAGRNSSQAACPPARERAAAAKGRACVRPGCGTAYARALCVCHAGWHSSSFRAY
jgi:hypothetical protein